MPKPPSSPAAAEGTPPTSQPATRTHEPVTAANRQRGHDDIARRAYERFCERGGEHGHDMEDWLLAERDLGGDDAETAA